MSASTGLCGGQREIVVPTATERLPVKGAVVGHVSTIQRKARIEGRHMEV